VPPKAMPGRHAGTGGAERTKRTLLSASGNLGKSAVSSLPVAEIQSFAFSPVGAGGAGWQVIARSGAATNRIGASGPSAAVLLWVA